MMMGSDGLALQSNPSSALVFRAAQLHRGLAGQYRRPDTDNLIGRRIIKLYDQLLRG